MGLKAYSYSLTMAWAQVKHYIAEDHGTVKANRGQYIRLLICLPLRDPQCCNLVGHSILSKGQLTNR